MIAGQQYEMTYWSKQQCVIGIDEAGRGPIAGPLVVAGIVLPPFFSLEGVYDSKKITEKQRNRLFPILLKEALSYIILVKDAAFVDRHNIYRATQLAMEECTRLIQAPIGGVLSDAMPLPACTLPVFSIIKGDQQSISIAAASILAKVTRDAIMEGYDALYPQYQFAKHKGYPTRAHIAAVSQYGICPIHRRSYGPIKTAMEKTLFSDIEKT